ncbi:uncharacterized protein LOC111435941 isoform X3 [Cucurbita moschata]|uniref:Uncharacterized protein LOC111435941 isoform X3 n=1 Tax=Cucurbita moschata TaxID=3662 RepID=A0A6J1ERT9_CUCMO|nr:uncharacterized protein LOC111435941 isoform X3 [Cucurbita moschata]
MLLQSRMAAGAACKRVGQSLANSGLQRFGVPKASSFESAISDHSANTSLAASISLISRYRHCERRQISQLAKSNGKRLFLVDTLALVRKLEGQGVPSNQAEAITAAITEVLNDSLENISHSFVSKGEMQKVEMIQDSNLSKFKSEVQSSQVTGLILSGSLFKMPNGLLISGVVTKCCMFRIMWVGGPSVLGHESFIQYLTKCWIVCSCL